MTCFYFRSLIYHSFPSNLFSMNVKKKNAIKRTFRIELWSREVLRCEKTWVNFTLLDFQVLINSNWEQDWVKFDFNWIDSTSRLTVSTFSGTLLSKTSYHIHISSWWFEHYIFIKCSSFHFRSKVENKYIFNLSLVNNPSWWTSRIKKKIQLCHWLS